MKKVFALLTVLALVLSMSVCACAAGNDVELSQGEGNRVVVTVNRELSSELGASVYFAVYGVTGRFLGFRTEPVVSGVSSHSYSFEIFDPNSARARAFVAGKSFEPLTEASEYADVRYVPEESSGSNILVAYFSFTGSTKRVAEYIAAESGADIFAIEAEVPYEANNSTYYDSSTRAYKEQYDGNNATRPETAGMPGNLADYDIVFLGFPTWYGQAPRIINTFLESGNFNGKVIIPFHTCSSTSISNMAAVRASAAGADFEEIKKFTSSSISESSVKTWTREEIEKYVSSAEEKMLRLAIDGETVDVNWEENASVEALKELVKGGVLSVQMSMYGGFEQVGSLGQSIVMNDVQTTTSAGDIVLYQGNQIVVFYGSNAWSYTRLGKISNKANDELRKLLSNGNVTITLSYE